MWILTIRSSTSSPLEYKVKPGRNTLGRKPDNDIVIADESASRSHAELYWQADILVINDLKSTNGTFVNRDKIIEPHVLRHDDQIRVGEYEINVTFREDQDTAGLVTALAVTRPLTRDLLLESVDQHAVLLYEIANRLTTIIDLNTALQEVSKLMRTSMGAEKCEVILADQFDHMAEMGFPTTVAQQAIEQRSVVCIPRLKGDTDRELSQSTVLLKVRSILCVPVIIEGDVAALVYVYKTDPAARPFDHHDIQLAVAISHQTALTIHRANLLEQSHILEQRASIDGLTGLYNRDHFLTLSDREFQRSKRHHHPMSIIMLDVDDFKLVNDTCGHMTGDQVIRSVAMSCLKQVRGSDLTGRFGGDEFVISLVETDIEGATHVAERIRQSIESNPVDTEKGSMSITVSLGVATLSEGCPDLKAMLDLADHAMYEVKNTGKNRVEVAKIP